MATYNRKMESDGVSPNTNTMLLVVGHLTMLTYMVGEHGLELLSNGIHLL